MSHSGQPGSDGSSAQSTVRPRGSDEELKSFGSERREMGIAYYFPEESIPISPLSAARLRRGAEKLRLRKAGDGDRLLGEVVGVIVAESILIEHQVNQDHPPEGNIRSRVQHVARGFGTHALQQVTDWYGRPDGSGGDLKLLAAELITHCLDAATFPFDRREARPEFEFRPQISSRLIQALRDLAVAAARVVEPPGARGLQAGNLFGNLAQNLPDGAAGDAFLRGGRGQVLGIDAPEFPGIGKVKLAADGSAETTLQHGGKGLGSGSGSRQELAGCVGKDAQGKGLGEPKEQVQRLQGKVDPTALQKDSAMAGLIQKGLPQQAMQDRKSVV